MDKKRDKKQKDKAKTHPGTVNFEFKPKEKKRFGQDKKGSASKGKDGKQLGKRTFSKSKPGAKRPQQGDKSNSKVRREKSETNQLKKKLIVNYNKLILKKKELVEQHQEDKVSIVKESIDMIGDKFKELLFKHDGCRVLQALIKHGSTAQKTFVINQIKSEFVNLVQQKYSHHLAQKMFYYAPQQE